MTQTSIYQTNLHALKCEHNKYTISYMIRYFLSAIVSFDLFRNVRHSHSITPLLISTHIKILLKTQETHHTLLKYKNSNLSTYFQIHLGFS